MNTSYGHSFISSRALRLAFSLVGTSLIVGLGLFAESIRKLNSFASAHAASVLANTWLVGRVGGWLSAILAALMLGYADHVSTGAHEDYIGFRSKCIYSSD